MTFHKKIWLVQNHCKPVRVNEFGRVYDGTRYLELFGGKNYNLICNSIIYHRGVKSCITYDFFSYLWKNQS